MQLSPDERARLTSNIFHAAHPIIDELCYSRWHRDHSGSIDTDKLHSSQALAIDVFGTIIQSPERDNIMDAIAKDLELPAGGGWNIELEWIDKDSNGLKEKRRTQVDVMAENHNSIIFIECKFTEPDGGACSQTKSIGRGSRKGLIQCDGDYHWQVNPANGKGVRCSLTGKGIRYWEAIPQIFNFDPNTDYAPCPFKGPEYQWMRNLTVCWQYAKDTNKIPAFVVVYADGPNLPMAVKATPAEWNKLLHSIRFKSEALIFERRSFQEVISLAKGAVQKDGVIFHELDDWVQNKIARATSRRDG